MQLNNQLRKRCALRSLTGFKNARVEYLQRSKLHNFSKITAEIGWKFGWRIAKLVHPNVSNQAKDKQSPRVIYFIVVVFLNP